MAGLFLVQSRDRAIANGALATAKAQYKQHGFARGTELKMPGCYWAGGPWWGEYRLSIEPRNGIDRPQMKILAPDSVEK